MELFKKETNVNFMGMRRITGSISIVVCIASIIILIIKGLAFGLEFTGGTEVELRFEQNVTINSIEKKLRSVQFKDFRVQVYGTSKDILVKIANSADTDEKFVSEKLNKIFTQDEIRRVDYVGSEVCEQLAEQGGMAVLVSILATMIYIALRFEYRFAISSAVGLTHDAIIVLGLLSLFQVEFDLSTLAAILAMLGYSLNDTIVVFDRARENFRKIRKGTAVEIMNISINQTLTRTIMTSFLTLLVVIALLIFGGSSLFSFSLAIFLGIIIGTYSSIYVAGTLALFLGLSRSDLLPRVKAELEDMP